MNDRDFVTGIRIAALTLAVCILFFALTLTGCATKPPTLTPEEEQAVAVGCDNNPECMLAVTDEIIASKILQLEYEREDRRIVRRDKLIVFLNSCDQTKGVVLIETLRIGRSSLPNKMQKIKALRKWGYKYTHENVHRRALRHDF